MWQAGISIRVMGFNHKLKDLHAMVVKELVNFKQDEVIFDVVKVIDPSCCSPSLSSVMWCERSRTVDCDRQNTQSMLYAFAHWLIGNSYMRLQAILARRWTDEQLLECLDTTTLADIVVSFLDCSSSEHEGLCADSV